MEKAQLPTGEPAVVIFLPRDCDRVVNENDGRWLID
jgi:hypothetical protein